MRTTTTWRLLGALALAAVAFAGAGELLAAQEAHAAAPGGIACVTADGKINGRGATYEDRAEALFWSGYNSDVCGPSSGTDVAGANMGIYDYPTAVAGGFTGAGAGQKAANCRTDAYAGSSLPYTQAVLAGLNGTPGNNVVGGCSTFPVQPFAPNATTNTAYPSPSDVAAPIMSFPIVGSSVALPVNLTAADCGGTKPASLQLNAVQLAAIWNGDAQTWNDPRLVSGNPSLTNCSTAITRVVRFDNSGTTGILKSYLVRVNDARTGTTCAAGSTWTSYNGSPNTSWPVGTGCSPTVKPTTSGGAAELALLQSTRGAIGYADLSDAVADTTGLIVPSIQNAAGTAYTAPSSGKGANCDFSTLSLPGFSSADAVGLNTSDNWGSDNDTVNGQANHMNATDLGAKYPICGLTFDLVYTGLSAGPTNPSAIAALSADQRRTLYSYITYVLSSTAQTKLGSNYYAPLPSTWDAVLQAGFQAGY